jgi:hypothetical protein
MNYMKFVSIVVIAVAGFAIGCGGTEPANNANFSNTTNTSNNNSPGTLGATTPTPAATKNDAPTLTPVFQAYCVAMEKKDEAGVRRVYSADTLENFQEQMEEDGLASLMEVLSTDNVTTALCEIRNEEITGNEAVAEVRTASMPNGGKILFVKEGNDWKLTNRVPGFEKR